MKAIKVLSFIVALLLLLDIVHIINIIVLRINDSGVKFDSIEFSIISLVASAISFLLLFLGLINIIKKGYFNKSTPNYFNASGILLILYSIVQIGFYVWHYGISNVMHIYYEILHRLLVLLIAVSLIAIAKILKDGIVLKTENELTI